MEKNAAAGRTPSSLPMSTPPPLALNSSPKFAPLSPVHTKSLNQKVENVTSHLTVPLHEDDGIRGQTNLSDQRHMGDGCNDRYPSGGHLSPSSPSSCAPELNSVAHILFEIDLQHSG